ncbi:alpha/beta fold hydrolase [Glutamicibacter arilaitensis]|uniref:alpha/beta fold hydrolase n=1 Tax=Glutamicibacter arilaitensis TaxID=256701 RepID=UPI003A93B6F0
MATETQQSLQLPELKGCEHLHIQLHDGFIHLASMGNGQPVLLLPGWGQSWWEWREVMPALASAGYRALALDLRGEGWSRLPIAAISRTQRAQDLLELIDIMQLDSVTVVGHDLGAIAAYQVAFDRPQRIRRLAMLAVPPPQMKFDLALLPGLRHLWHQEALAIPGLGRKLMSSGFMCRHFYSDVFLTRKLSPEVVAQYDALMRHPATARAAELICRRIVLPELMRIMAGTYRRQRLSMPTKFVFGSKDTGFPAKVLHSVFAAPEKIGPDASLGLISGAGHFLVDEEPAAVARVLLEFLAETP